MKQTKKQFIKYKCNGCGSVNVSQIPYYIRCDKCNIVFKIEEYFEK